MKYVQTQSFNGMRSMTGIASETYLSNKNFKVIIQQTIDMNVIFCIKDKFVVARIGFDRSLARVLVTTTYVNTA
jgi:hypothetical protein